MKVCGFFRTAFAGGVLCFLLFLPTAHSQDRPPFAASQTSSQTSSFSAEEKFLFDAANRERAALHLQSLHWDARLAAAARQHAQFMAREHDLSHQYPGEPPLDQRAAHSGARFAAIAENIARGPDAGEIHEGWMHSPGHRKNILNPEVSAVGIAVVRGREGLFAVQDFSRFVPDMSLGQQEQSVIALLSQIGLRSAEATDDARKTCSATNGFSDDRPSEVFRFETADLSKLPDEVSKAVHARAFRRVAVGACATNEAAGFVRFRFALMLY